jgi:hypothetical protein
LWIAGGSIQGQSNRPLDVYADTCLLNCTGPLTGISNNQTPVQYKLMQNYPNPFNPVTKISFQIPKGDLVTIIVSDLLGKEVFKYSQRYESAGTYSLDFNGSDHSSGAYFYQLNTENFTETKKMVLVK